MIAVSALSSYLFCPRKMFMQYILGFQPIEVDRIVKGEIKHNVFDCINKAEEEIVKRITPENLNEAGMIYKQEYYKALMETVELKEAAITRTGIDKQQLLEETWDKLVQEAELRAKNITEFAIESNLYGKELWDNLKLKFVTEMSVMSTTLKLRGRIDRVEIEEEKYIPIELKTGTMPINGMWPGDRIQLGAYILLLRQKYRSEHGFLEYTNYGTRKKLEMTEKLSEEIINLVGEVHDTMKGRFIPKKCEGNKCTNCNMKENCETIKENYINEEGQEPYA
jgi:CRISPR-associated exonuclease Cas4